MAARSRGRRSWVSSPACACRWGRRRRRAGWGGLWPRPTAPAPRAAASRPAAAAPWRCRRPAAGSVAKLVGRSSLASIPAPLAERLAQHHLGGERREPVVVAGDPLDDRAHVTVVVRLQAAPEGVGEQLLRQTPRKLRLFRL